MPLQAARRRLPLAGRGVEIALLDWGGDGPLALLHHANGFCAALWEPVALGLRSRFRVVAMDARGHGSSSKPEGEGAYRWERFAEDALAVARALLEERGEERAGLALGHSFGGTALLGAAAVAPDLFELLVMLDPVLHPPPDPARGVDPQRVARVGELAERAGSRRQVFGSRAEARDGWSDKPLFAHWQPGAFDLYLEEGLVDRPDGQVELACPARVEAEIFRTGFEYDAWATASRAKTPSLLLWAEQGDFPRVAYEGIAARMPDASVRDVPTGHLMVMEDPERVVAEVLRFADEHAPR